MKNPFYIGQKVVCISDKFPYMPEYGGESEYKFSKPKRDEILIIEDILGDFLTFKEYNNQTGEGDTNWFMYDRFASLISILTKDAEATAEKLFGIPRYNLN